MAGTSIEVNDIKVAVVCVVVKEPATESKLSDLKLHWGCVDRQGGKWAGPPAIYNTYPDFSIDAGGTK